MRNFNQHLPVSFQKDFLTRMWLKILPVQGDDTGRCGTLIGGTKICNTFNQPSQIFP